MKKRVSIYFLLFTLTQLICGCSYNPFIANNHLTGSPAGAAIGAGVGVGGTALLNAPKPVMAIAGIGGGMLGYYVTTLRYDAGGIFQAGGQVYKVGGFIGIYMQTDKLFETNTAILLPQAEPILDSAVQVLNRTPRNNIVISGNTSGFYRSKWEQCLSEERAKVVSAYLWNAGINNFKDTGPDMRKLNYVGHGDYFPIASDLTEEGLRSNSRIQITSYPSDCDLRLDQGNMTVHNIGATDDSGISNYSKQRCRGNGDC
ncbi:MAG: OmpA family protein [Gammaproteobacteria bacterium]|nr:OmpA family protein [Gammaproteobacteria bacterium]